MTRLTAKEFREQMIASTRTPKYRNRKIKVDGETFDSTKEYKRWLELRQLEMAGEITGLERQPKFWLEIDGRPILIRSERYRRGRRASYKADFAYFKDGQRIIEDVKTAVTRTEAYALRKGIVEAMYPGTRIVEV